MTSLLKSSLPFSSLGFSLDRFSLRRTSSSLCSSSVSSSAYRSSIAEEVLSVEQVEQACRVEPALSVLRGAKSLKSLRKFGLGQVAEQVVLDRPKKFNDFKRLGGLENQVV